MAGLVQVSQLVFLIAVFVGQAPVDVQAQQQQHDQGCAGLWNRAYECVESIKASDDAKWLEKKQEEIYNKCVPNPPKSCVEQKQKADKCQQKMANDPDLQALRIEIGKNVSTCFEKFPPHQGAAAPQDFTAGGMPPQQPPMGEQPQGKDPCEPTAEQARCMQTEAQKDTEGQTIAKRLEEMQRKCFVDANNGGSCRIDNNPSLRDCIEQVKHPFMGTVFAKMQQCMQSP